MEVMNVLWDALRALTINEIVDGYQEPKPAYTTVATFHLGKERHLRRVQLEELHHLLMEMGCGRY